VVLNACQRLTREVREFERGVTGMVHIGVAVMFSTDITAQVAENLAQQYPRLAVVVTDAFFEDLMRRMHDGRLDLIFSNFPQFPASADFVIEPLLKVRSHVVAGRSHPLAKRREVTRADLVDHRWVIADQPHAADTFEKYFATDGVPAPRDVFRTNSFSLMRHLVESGRFLSMLPEHVVRAQVLSGDIRRLPLAGDVIERQAGLIYRKGAAARPAMQHVLAEYRRVCDQFVKESSTGS
jgi:DNA-binding transcriptional LysR family regulator